MNCEGVLEELVAYINEENPEYSVSPKDYLNKCL